LTITSLWTRPQKESKQQKRGGTRADPGGKTRELKGPGAPLHLNRGSRKIRLSLLKSGP